MTHAFQFRRPEGVQVTYRRMKFDFEDQGFERYWHSGSPFKSLFWSQLSAEEAREEIARMPGGIEITKETRAAAREMIRTARR